MLQPKLVEIKNIINAEQQALNRVRKELYNYIFKEYSEKQWGMPLDKLEPEVAARIPFKYNFDCNYFDDKYQALPQNGYTKFIQNILNHENIKVLLNTESFDILKYVCQSTKVIYTGRIDQCFPDSTLPSLPYRSLYFEENTFKESNYKQPVAVLNHPSKNVKYTRTLEFKHLLTQKSEYTTLIYEYPSSTGEPYYPIPSTETKNIYNEYIKLSKIKNYYYFLGRLANYKYFNMDQAIENSLNFFANNKELL